MVVADTAAGARQFTCWAVRSESRESKSECRWRRNQSTTAASPCDLRGRHSNTGCKTSLKQFGTVLGVLFGNVLDHRHLELYSNKILGQSTLRPTDRFRIQAAYSTAAGGELSGLPSRLIVVSFGMNAIALGTEVRRLLDSTSETRRERVHTSCA